MLVNQEKSQILGFKFSYPLNRTYFRLNRCHAIPSGRIYDFLPLRMRSCRFKRKTCRLYRRIPTILLREPHNTEDQRLAGLRVCEERDLPSGSRLSAFRAGHASDAVRPPTAWLRVPRVPDKAKEQAPDLLHALRGKGLEPSLFRIGT